MTKAEREKMKSIARSAYELKEKVRDCGSHFFDPSSMRSFRSRLADKMHVSKTGKATFFVTSEQFEMRYPEYRRDPRRYTVRKFANCEISEVGEFQQHKTSAAAHGAAKRAAESGEFGRRKRKGH